MESSDSDERGKQMGGGQLERRGPRRENPLDTAELFSCGGGSLLECQDPRLRRGLQPLAFN
jgi:hypothetical protein